MHPIAEKYLRKSALPMIFCPGCGHGTVLNAFLRAVDDLGIIDDLSLVGGIGCSSWAPVFVNTDVLHTLHGRAIAVATGLKLAQPRRHVVVFTGDGDCIGIGGNHFMHAARRNIDLTVILLDNNIYGMTGGQVSPTTPLGTRTTTTPYLNLEHPFKIADVVAAAGGSYVARWTTYHAFQLMESMQNAIHKKGFSFVEIISQCPVSYGKMTGTSDPVTLLEQLRDASIHVDDTKGMSEEELEGKFVVGKLVERQRGEFGDALRRLVAERRESLSAELENGLRQDTSALETGR